MFDAQQTQKDRLIHDLHTLAAEAEKLLHATAGEAGAASSDLRAKVQATLDRARGNLRDMQGAAVDRAKAAGQATDAYVHDNPWQSIGAATAIGVLLGLLIARGINGRY